MSSIMRAFVLTGPREYGVQEVPAPVAVPGEVVVDVERAGVCGTDVEFFTGEMPYLHDGHAAYPMRLGHEWAGTVSAVGDGVDPAWLGRRVMGDTMLGDRTCRRCRKGHQHTCDQREEVGIRGGRPGALAEKLAVPAWSLHALPRRSTPSSAPWSNRAATPCARRGLPAPGRGTGRSCSGRGRSGC